MAINSEFKILSIDGGGVRGVIPARILQYIETETKKPISDLFDLIVGTSTGGIISLALTCPNQYNRAKFTAEDVLELYKEHSKDIFKKSFLRSVMTGSGLWAAKYSRNNYDSILDKLFSDTTIGQAVCPVVVPTYSLKLGSPNIFTSNKQSKNSDTIDCLMRDVAEATSAAPTYFPPKAFRDKKGNNYLEIDAGIYANNPQSIGVAEALQIKPNLKKEDVCVVSIGTGAPKFYNPISKLGNAGIINWFLKANIIDIMMDADSDWYTEETAMRYPNSFRLQTPIPQKLARMDNASPDNINGLINTAENFIEKNQKVLDRIVGKIV